MSSFLYVCSFRPAGSGGGIHGFRWRSRGNHLEPLGVVSRGIDNPLAQTVSANGHHLYVADCTADWRSGGAIYSHRIDPLSGRLETCGAVDSAGLIPVFLILSHDGRNLFVANCGPFAPNDDGRTVAVFPVKADGVLGPAKTIQQHLGTSGDPERQNSAHPHCVAIAPDNHRVWVPDLGTDSIWCYDYDPRLGALMVNPARTVDIARGSGPRMLKFHPDGHTAYLVNEMANTLITYRYENGQLNAQQSQTTLMPGQQDRNAADLLIHPQGHALYVSNRRVHCISIFSLEPGTGLATLIGQVDSGGDTPRGMTLDERGRFLLAGNESTDSIHGFRIAEDGALQSIGRLAEMPGPACLNFVSF